MAKKFYTVQVVMPPYCYGGGTRVEVLNGDCTQGNDRDQLSEDIAFCAVVLANSKREAVAEAIMREKRLRERAQRILESVKANRQTA